MRLGCHVLQIAIVIQQVSEVLGLSGEWTQWGQWSSCSVTCGYGVQKRQKTWKERERTGRKGEDFVYEDIIECITEKSCPIDGAWGFWGPWGECTKMCDGGTTTRKRECNAPEPQNGGLKCEGKNSATIECNTWICPDLPPFFDIRQCNETTFMCLSGQQCIPEANRCDHTLQCHDGSDEHDCFYYNWHNAAGTNALSVLQLFWTTLFTSVMVFLGS